MCIRDRRWPARRAPWQAGAGQAPERASPAGAQTRPRAAPGSRGAGAHSASRAAAARRPKRGRRGPPRRA
eukprot:8354672-Lingulodinium_polyedra.AAC.1